MSPNYVEDDDVAEVGSLVIFCIGIKGVKIELLRHRKATPYWQNSSENFHIKKNRIWRVLGEIWWWCLTHTHISADEKHGKVGKDLQDHWVEDTVFIECILAHIPSKILVFIMTRKKIVGN